MRKGRVLMSHVERTPYQEPTREAMSPTKNHVTREYMTRDTDFMSEERLEYHPLVLRRPQAAISHIAVMAPPMQGLSTKKSSRGGLV
jgi:hypothetical protein